MATVAAVIASTHHPFYCASTATGEDRPPFADEWVAKIEAFRETLTISLRHWTLPYPDIST
jgi:protocatechuate 4,5-dioxygenase beta chain